MSTLEDYLFVRNTKWLWWGLLALLVTVLIFLCGFAAGERQGPRARMARGFAPSFSVGGFSLPNAFIVRGHGASGTIESLASSSFTLAEPDREEVTVEFSSTTPMSAALRAGAFVIVIGDPESSGEGDIDARFIRVLPAPATTSPMQIF